jgi:hypothetical protein
VQRSDCAYSANEAASTVVAAQGRTRNYSCIPSREEGRVVDDVLIYTDNDEDDFQVFDDALPCNKEFDNDSNNEDTPASKAPVLRENNNNVNFSIDVLYFVPENLKKVQESC